MSDAFLLGLVQNTSLLLAAAFIFSMTTTRWRASQTLFQQVVVGLALGAIAVTIMLTPVKLMPGIVFDTRSVLIGTSGLFFGPFSTVIAMVVTGAFRFYMGGTGAWTGITVTIASGMIGVAWRYFRRRSLTEISFCELYLFGIVIHLTMLAAMFTLPWETALQVLSNISLPVLVVYPLGTALLGALMVNWMRRERVDKELKESEKKYRELIDGMNETVWVIDFDGNLIDVNKTAVEFLGYSKKELLTIGLYGIDSSLKKEDIRSLANTMPTDKLQIFETSHTTKDGRTFPVEVYSSLVTYQGKQAIMSIARNIASRRQAEEDLKRTTEKLRKNLAGTIQAMSLTVEARDPYTAGHQKRVSNLARAIALEMELPGDRVDAIRMAGVIHDIGKLSVPAEILSKPTKLTDIEFDLIKVHPRAGYDILKDVDLPYPIAEMVLQHHEKLDGSGYPRELKNGQILLEACILTVADVVEAMASHRPYRPALGIEKAIEEIERNKGILYDTGVAQACLKLFREKDYKFG